MRVTLLRVENKGNLQQKLLQTLFEPSLGCTICEFVISPPPARQMEADRKAIRST